MWLWALASSSFSRRTSSVAVVFSFGAALAGRVVGAVPPKASVAGVTGRELQEEGLSASVHSFWRG